MRPVNIEHVLHQEEHYEKQSGSAQVAQRCHYTRPDISNIFVQLLEYQLWELFNVLVITEEENEQRTEWDCVVVGVASEAPQEACEPVREEQQSNDLRISIQ